MVTAEHPKRRLGQHFLHDPRVIERIVAAIDPRPNDLIVEIGAGTGALTSSLLERLDTLHVIELDPNLAHRLPISLSRPEAVVVHKGDALQFDYLSLKLTDKKLRVVGNLPYNISTPLLFQLLSQRGGIADMHLMLQKEVVDRMAANPGSKRYGRLTVMLAMFLEIEKLFDIGPGAFRPPPKVWSSMVRLTPRQQPLVPLADPGLFAELVRHAFSMRRKILANGLKKWFTKSELTRAGLDPEVRAETLAPEVFAQLANLLSNGGEPRDNGGKVS